MPAAAPLTRDAAVAALPDEVDVLVVGGGITGAGVALDAASRGARVALVERGDLAHGTSSRSSRLVHGGIRYLATGDVAMVAEGVRERDRLRRMAPHLVLPLPFVIPAASRSDLARLRVGMTVYDTLAAGRGVARHRTLDPAQVLRAAPGLAGDVAAGGVRYWDCRTDDSRLTLAVARAAVGQGAVVAPYVEVTGFETAGGRVVAATVRDVVVGGERTIRARWIVSATGIWAGAVRALEPTTDPLEVVASRGVHLVFDRRDLPVNAAIVLPSAAGDGRRLFVIPWGRQVYVGTTDEAHAGSLDDPHVDAGSAAYVLAATNAAFGTGLRVTDAVGAWAGLRPLLRTGRGAVSDHTADLSRRHAIVEAPAGLVTITGGKLTTFRRMAAEVVDRIARADGWPARSRTADLSLGSSGDVAEGRSRVRALATRVGLDPDAADGLHHRHGDRADAVLRTSVAAGEAVPLVDGLPYLRGEVRWAARTELVTRLSDVLERRLRVSTRHRAAGGRDAIAWAAAAVGDELGWDRSRRTAEVAGYLDGVRRGRGDVPLDLT